MIKYYTFIILTIGLTSCSFLNQNKPKKAIARVGEEYLYVEDFVKIFPKNILKKDSTIFANQYIKKWATQQILKQRAVLNLPIEVLQDFNKLTEEYKTDLYTNTYLDALISKKIDTAITQQNLDTLYVKIKENFKLNEALFQVRYLSIDKNNTNIFDFSKRIQQFDSIDKVVLDSLSIQYHSYLLNDSIWLKKSKLIKKLPILKTLKDYQLLKKTNFLQLEDSLRVYLVYINNLLLRNEQATQEYVAPTLKQIILNKRKLELIKQLKIELRKDATQNKEFEIYN